MVGSRPSLRRPNLRAYKSSTSRSSSPSHDEPPPLLPKSGNEGIAVRSKRLRAATLSVPEHDLKRRRLSSSHREKPQLRIPLRSRGGLAKVLPPPVFAPIVPPKRGSNTKSSHITPIPLDSPSSPSGKPQYDQIRLIEEKAKASIIQRTSATNHEERRKLRSEDGGSRAKTELAQYFPDFEEMLSLKPPHPGMVPIAINIPPLTLNRSIDSQNENRPH